MSNQLTFFQERESKLREQINKVDLNSMTPLEALAYLNELKKEGCGADVVSMGELSAALKSGIKPSKIVFSGVGKTDSELRLAIKKRVLLINVESESEALLINKISNHKLGLKNPM